MKDFLLPYRFKWIGAGLVIAGSSGLVCFLWFDFILTLPVFAVVSSIIETKIMAVVRTNVADELIMVTLLAGFFLMVFSKDNIENADSDHLRIRAFSKAVWANVALLFLGILFFFGKGFLVILLLNLFSLFIFYLLFFFLEKRKNNRERIH